MEWLAFPMKCLILCETFIFQINNHHPIYIWSFHLIIQLYNHLITTPYPIFLTFGSSTELPECVANHDKRQDWNNRILIIIKKNLVYLIHKTIFWQLILLLHKIDHGCKVTTFEESAIHHLILPVLLVESCCQLNSLAPTSSNGLEKS